MADDPQNPTPEEQEPGTGGGSPQPSDSGALSQEDIDAALNAAQPGGDQAPPSDASPSGEEAPAPADTSPSGEFSQDDIDALMGAADAQPEGETAPTDAADSGSLSQADIDAALNAGAPADPVESTPQPAGPPGANASAQDQIDAMLSEAEQSAEDVKQPAADTRLDSEGRPFDAQAAAMAAAIAEEAAAKPATSEPDAPTPVKLDLPDFAAGQGAPAARDISILRDVNLHVHIELGRTHMYIEDVLRLSEGSVVELDNLAGDPVDVIVNGRLIARGEVLILSDNFCVRISEIVSGPQNVAVA